MNLGLESLGVVRRSALSVDDGALFLQLTSDLLNVDSAFADVTRGFSVVEQLTAIQNTVKQYGCTESLMSLYGDNNITFSVESIGEKISNAWKWIKDKLQQLWNWVKGLFQRLFSVKKSIDNDIKTAKERIAALKADPNRAQVLANGKIKAISGEAMGEWIKLCNTNNTFEGKLNSLQASLKSDSNIVNNIESLAAEIKENSDALTALKNSLKEKTSEQTLEQIVQHLDTIKKFTDPLENKAKTFEKTIKTLTVECDRLEKSGNKAGANSGNTQSMQASVGRSLISAMDSYKNTIATNLSIGKYMSLQYKLLINNAALKKGETPEETMTKAREAK